MYENQTRDAIKQRMLDNSRTDVDKRQGAVTYDLTAPAAPELERLWIELDSVLDKGFALNLDGTQSSFGEWLRRRCGELGVYAKPSEKSKGFVTFTGNEGTRITTGMEVSTDGENPVYFVIKSEGVIVNGTVTLAAEAKVGGKSGNVREGAIKLTQGNITGITGVTNEQPFGGGIDEESDEALLARYLDRVRKPITSGNRHHYRAWAMEVTGISDAKVYEVWDGPGTVKVVLLDDRKRAPSDELIGKVVDHIESERPVNAEVTVVGAAEIPINVSARITLNSGKTIEDATTEITDAITEYLTSLALVDPVVRYTRIAGAIGDALSVLDYADLTVNGGTSNVIVGADSVAVLGAVTLSV
ncbi:baseplate J/gp47 family protein [Brevibacillus daliensis]|uniref:baseplate J/gp47 family protein n=1 Tax=Brevibacillus daliensis TaxID=2892995 RepID=UPI001E45AA1E|nr:baseplate J/gp47 family protein [Brevibacillus daliensis]